MSPAPSDWREKAAFRNAEEAYLRPPEPDPETCGVCGGLSHDCEYFPDSDQHCCDLCDPEDLEQ